MSYNDEIFDEYYTVEERIKDIEETIERILTPVRDFATGKILYKANPLNKKVKRNLDYLYNLLSLIKSANY